MKIQFNNSKNMTGSEDLKASLTARISEELKRFRREISRLEVHLSDEDGLKNGSDDKRCMIEARVGGRQPIAVTSHANTNEQAVLGAIDKLKASLNKISERMRNY